MRQPLPGNRDFVPLPRTLTGLVGLIAIIEIILTMSDEGLLFGRGLRLAVFNTGAFWSPLLRGVEPIFAAQPWSMFISHAVLHGGFLHMAMNMAVLLAMGRFVSDRYGSGVILPLFFLGAIGGGAMFGLLSASPAPMIGTSGVVFTFLGVWIVWDWRRHARARLSTRPVMTRVLVLAGLNVVFFFALAGGLAWETHLGGFIVGLIAGLWLENREEARVVARRRGL
ncbi:rhomboid family intramembrane serine protease [Amaricoccus tamworthensis]|uniref:rhomboid family intramembrane serine protease n=1 Tax=Amaricoccus tamworthensis TaxID=57002 RepID=UPI003C7DBEED